MYMLTGRENYLRTIEFGTPDFTPMQLWCPFESLLERDETKKARIRELARQLPDDLLGVNPTYPTRGAVEDIAGVKRWTDHWGTGWIDDGRGGRTETHPLEAGYHLVDTYPFPDPHDQKLYDAAEEALAKREHRYVLASVWFTLFERLWMLRGFDNMLVDPLIDTTSFLRLRDIVLEHALAVTDEWLKRRVDGVFFSDDWGSQRGLLISPEDWRRYWRPAYARLFQRVRDGGAHVWMHLCGDIRAILPDLIELGLNVLNPVQPQAMPIHELARDFQGKVCFFGGVDVQGVLVSGGPEQVRAHVHEIVGTLRSPSGGYILGTSHGVMPETPLDNVIALYETAIECAGYPE